MKSSEIREKFLKFFKERGHAIIPSASLVPDNDPTALFNTAGMQPLVPYLMGESHPMGMRLANIQKCVRTGDIDDVGDNRHLTFFEMMGNWSLGDYFKEDAIKWSYEFLTSQEGLSLDPSRLYVTIFEGDENTSLDEESKKVWMSLGIPEHRIYPLGADDNWWSVGENGPCGPDTEMFYDMEGELGDLSKNAFVQAVKEERIVEIWNDVFMEFVKKNGRVVGKLAKKNVDTGAGLERMAAVMQGKKTAYHTDIFAPIISKINEISRTPNEKSIRIVADHIRTAVFLAADGVRPSNTDRGYVLRKLIRRAVRHAHKLSISGSLDQVIDVVQKKYKDIYPEVVGNLDGSEIQEIIVNEEVKFKKTLEKGLSILNRELKAQMHKPGESYEIQNIRLVYGPDESMVFDHRPSEMGVTGKWLFNFYQTLGFPPEMILEELSSKGYCFHQNQIEELMGSFNREMENHQALSRTGSEQKFKGGLGDNSEMSVKYHTATHLLHQALHDVLGDEVGQKGSNITPERLRFDFSFTRKMTDEEKKQVEEIVNKKISESLPVNKVVMPKVEAEKTGARHFFGEKYPDEVSVYYIGDSLESAYSKEFCGGPHISNTSELGHFKITKEEAVSAGTRRIKAVLE